MHKKRLSTSLMTAMGADTAVTFNSFNLTDIESTNVETIKAKFVIHSAPTLLQSPLCMSSIQQFTTNRK